MHGWGFLLYAAFVIIMCNTCGDIVRNLDWHQLDLFGSHELRFTSCECLCGYRLISVTVKEYDHADKTSG